jgi:hypothetical protein
VLPALVELEPRTDDEIADSSRDQNLARAREGTDARSDVNSEPADVAITQFDLADM